MDDPVVGGDPGLKISEVGTQNPSRVGALGFVLRERYKSGVARDTDSFKES